MSKKAGGYMISHVSNHVISWSWYQKGVQMIFLKKLINILNKRRSREENMGKKGQWLFLGQNVGLVCR